ncbi:MAG: heme exporter protein CcmD [Alphaproteobacteria bacterium]|nr:heme exporter protein CcmD [Alphaproteobacteria bacterium]
MDAFLAETAAFLHMEGYGAYIWPCYGLAIAIFIALTVWARQKLREAQRTLKQLQGGHDA